jgi:cation diffusion facilitator family transporter
VGHHHHHHFHPPDRSREGVRAVLKALALLAVTAAVQAVVYVASDSVALLADLIHNGGDALTAIPIGIAFALHSHRLERWSGLAVVLAVFISACVAFWQAIERLIDPRPLSHLGALAAAGAVGFVGNEAAAWVRLRAGRRLNSPALVADGYHARTDGIVSLGVVLSALAVWAGAEVVDPAIAIAITLVILRISWQSWQTVRAG